MNTCTFLKNIFPRADCCFYQHHFLFVAINFSHYFSFEYQYFSLNIQICLIPINYIYFLEIFYSDPSIHLHWLLSIQAVTLGLFSFNISCIHSPLQNLVQSSFLVYSLIQLAHISQHRHKMDAEEVNFFETLPCGGIFILFSFD